MVIINGKTYYSKLEQIVSNIYNWGDNKDTKPILDVPQPKYKTADELFNEAINFAKQNTPLAYGAREGALADYAKGNDYYSSFQPTSFEQALGNQYFQNVMPDVERSIKHNLSLSGMANSPILASQIATQRGNLGVNIGEYLSNLANQRATNSLNARMGIDPYSTYQNYLGLDTGQSNMIENADLKYQQALIDAENERRTYMEKSRNADRSAVGKYGGGTIGAVLGTYVGQPVMGYQIGSQLGSQGAQMFNTDTMQNYNAYNNRNFNTGSAQPNADWQSILAQFGGNKQGSAQPVYNNGFDLTKLIGSMGNQGNAFSNFGN